MDLGVESEAAGAAALSLVEAHVGDVDPTREEAWPVARGIAERAERLVGHPALAHFALDVLAQHRRPLRDRVPLLVHLLVDEQLRDDALHQLLDIGGAASTMDQNFIWQQIAVGVTPWADAATVASYLDRIPSREHQIVATDDVASGAWGRRQSDPGCSPHTSRCLKSAFGSRICAGRRSRRETTTVPCAPRRPLSSGNSPSTTPRCAAA